MINKISTKYKYLFSELTPKRLIVVCFDLIVCVVTLWLSFFLRLDVFLYLDELPSYPLITSILLWISMILIFRIHKSLNRYSGLHTFIQLSQALLIYGIIFSCIFTLNNFENVPRTIGIIQPILLALVILSSRAIVRYIFAQISFKTNSMTNCLIYGAGKAGRQLANVIDNDNKIHLKGFLDDEIKMHGEKINNREVFDPLKLNLIRDKLKINLVLLAIPSASLYQKTKILSQIQFLNIAVRTLPDLGELTSGSIDMSNLRDLNINDLLGRTPININTLNLNNNFKGKTIIVTGGGGSLGSEICRQICQLKPSRIIIIELNEYSLYNILSELNTGKSNKTIDIVPKLISVLDKRNLEKVFQKYKPTIVFHAAAYKHVQIVEENPNTGIENNVFGTLNMCELSEKYRISNFLLISTDKAVRPTNLMGASKRLSELIIQAFEIKSKNSKFSMVRFGNVLGSSGSVVPKFLNQIKSGGPITLTDKKVTRFFMTINEAVTLVIKASIMAKGGEVFVLDMGDPIRIIDLAKKMISLSGKTIKDNNNPNGDIEIIITGLSKGEKLYEELLIGNNPKRTSEKKIMMAQEDFLNWKELNIYLKDLKGALYDDNFKKIKEILLNTKSYYPNK